MFDFSVLRGLRKREGLSLEALSALAGVSVAVISKIERNQCAAELETIYKLARAFEMNPSDLLGLAESRSAHLNKATVHKSDGFVFQEVSYGNIRCLHGSARKGGTTSKPEAHKDDYELCWILKGRVVVSLPNERRELSAGEAIQFDALLEHAYEVVEDCEVLILHIRKGKRF